LPGSPSKPARSGRAQVSGLETEIAGRYALQDLIPIRLLGPRPRFRRLARQPGIIAALAAALALTLAGIPFGLLFWLDESPYEIFLLLAVATYPGLAVLVAWMTLLVGRRWRAEPSWVDRLGRTLGVFWILAAFLITGASVAGMTF